MLNPNLGGLYSPQTIIGGLTPQKVNPTPVGDNEDDPVAKPNAVWIHDDPDHYFNSNDDYHIGWGGDTYRPGDVVFIDGVAVRYCVSADGSTYWAKTSVLVTDFESDRGDIRKQ